MKKCEYCKIEKVKRNSAKFCGWSCYSASKIGKKQSPHTKEHKQKIGEGLKRAYAEGRKVFNRTEQAKKNMSEAHKGNVGYWRNKRRLEITGENHYKWSGGKGSRFLERSRFATQIQKQVFERDSYTCQMCGATRDLHVDHIQRWSEYIELRFNIENCRTICRKCHYQITYGKSMPKNSKWGLTPNYIRKERG